MKKIAIILTILLIPTATSAQEWGSANSERFKAHARAAARREHRLMQHAVQPAPVIRFQRRVINLPFSPRRLQSGRMGRVIEVMDGSIFTVLLENGMMQEVRILGAEAPEIIRPETYQQCYSREARAALAKQILGKSVFLQKPDGYNRDSYRRKLYYIQLNGRDVGAWMIRNGYAFADKKNAHSRTTRYIDLELDAREYDRGLWSFRCDYEIDADEVIN